MAMGHDEREQPTLFVTYDKLQGLGHPFYEALDKLLRKHGFDRFAEKQCEPFYAEVMGRPGLAPGVYFRCLLIGYFEGISTHLAHKHEQAVDLETGAIVGVTVHGGAAGDTKTLEKTLEVADANLAEVRQEGSEKAKEQVGGRIEEVVADKGYHSNDVLTSLEEVDVRSYIPEPARGRRRWKDKQAERDAVYRNRRRVKRGKSKALQKKRSELVERPFAHMLDSGGMRRVHVRGHDNILKRLVIHAAGFNLSLIMRKVHGIGKPRALQGLRAALSAVLVAVLTLLRWLGALFGRDSRHFLPSARFFERAAHARLA